MIRQVLFRSWRINKFFAGSKTASPPCRVHSRLPSPPNPTPQVAWALWSVPSSLARALDVSSVRMSSEPLQREGGNGWPLTRRQKTQVPHQAPTKNTKNTKQNTSEKWTCLFVGVVCGRFVIFWNAWTSWRLKRRWWSVEGRSLKETVVPLEVGFPWPSQEPTVCHWWCLALSFCQLADKWSWEGVKTWNSFLFWGALNSWLKC